MLERRSGAGSNPLSDLAHHSTEEAPPAFRGSLAPLSGSKGERPRLPRGGAPRLTRERKVDGSAAFLGSLRLLGVEPRPASLGGGGDSGATFGGHVAAAFATRSRRASPALRRQPRRCCCRRVRPVRPVVLQYSSRSPRPVEWIALKRSWILVFPGLGKAGAYLDRHPVRQCTRCGTFLWRVITDAVPWRWSKEVKATRGSPQSNDLSGKNQNGLSGLSREPGEGGFQP